MPLAQRLLDEVKAKKIRVVFLPRAIATKWNQTGRQAGEPAQFTGFYWLNGHDEGGPFRSQSAAWRDAWYRVCEGEAPPDVHALFRGNSKR